MEGEVSNLHTYTCTKLIVRKMSPMPLRNTRKGDTSGLGHWVGEIRPSYLTTSCNEKTVRIGLFP